MADIAWWFRRRIFIAVLRCNSSISDAESMMSA
ncbi:hypothetical protein AC21_5523, partial [Escherichia coli 2-474-04_S3_C2]